MDLDRLEEAVTLYIKAGVTIDDVMEGHLDRLDTLIDVWGAKSLIVRRAGEYILVYSRRAVQKAYRALVDAISGFVEAILENQPLETLERRIPGLGLPPLLDSAAEKLERSGGAVVIGVDRETGKVFVHTLPWFMAGFIGLAGEHVDEDLVRALMGFDYNPWEGEAEEGSIIRLQGDMAVRLIRYFASDGEAVRWVAGALLRYRLANAIYKAGLLAVEEASMILLDHTKKTGSLTRIAYTVPMALAYGISKSYGDLIEERGGNIVEISIETRTPDQRVRPLSEPILVKAYVEADKVSFSRRLRDCIHREGRVCTGVEDTVVALNRVLEIASSLDSNADLSDVYLYAGGHMISVTGLDDVMATVASRIEDRIQDIINNLFTGEAGALGDGDSSIQVDGGDSGWGLLGEMASAELPRIRAVVKEAEVEVVVDDHSITVTGVVIDDVLVARALTLSYMAELASIIIERANNVSESKRLFRMIRRRRGEWRDILMALIRLLSIKTGTRYVLVLGDHVIEARHPEHGESSIGLPGPALVELTSLNTDVARIGGLFWEDPDLDFDIDLDDDLPPYNEDIDDLIL